MSQPGGPPGKLAKAATAATLRRTTLSPYDVIVLAAVEAVFREPGRQVLPTTDEIAAAARFDGQATLACLQGRLESQRLVVRGSENSWALTPLGTEVLAELIRRERRQHRGR